MLVERPIMQKAVSGSHRALNGVVQTLDSKLIFGLADGDDDVQLVMRILMLASAMIWKMCAAVPLVEIIP